MTFPLQKIEYDKNVDALYVKPAKGKVHKTYKLNSRVLLDVDKKGRLIGIEVLDASTPYDLSKIATKQKIYA